MNCYLCKGEMVNSTTSYVVDLNNCVIVVRNVPCMECKQCGEIAYSNEVALKLEKIVDNVKAFMTEVAIIDYTTAA